MSKDALSALIDGECTGPELDHLLGEMDRSPELARQWSRMVLAREARLGTQVGRDQPCICAGVMERLDDEAERPKLVDLAVHRASRAAALARTAVSPRRMSFWKPAVGFAAAASMGAAAVLLVQPQTAVDGLAADAGGAIAVPGFPSGGVSQPVAFDSPASLDADEQYRRMLREYLMDHSHSIAGEGMGSTMGFTRIVAHTADYRQQNSEEGR